jgi:hypothetical protein
MITWIQAHSALLLTGLGVLGVATFVVSLIALPIIIARLPVDHFVVERAAGHPHDRDRTAHDRLPEKTGIPGLVAVLEARQSWNQLVAPEGGPA